MLRRGWAAQDDQWPTDWHSTQNSEESLLECARGTNGLPALLLYGKSGWNCDVDARPTLGAGTPWQFYQQTTLTDLFQTFDLAPAPNNSRFFRAVRR